ncbi:MAG: MFS transporter [Alphaproteobacteria bacterium]
MNEPFYRTLLAVAPLFVGMALLIAGNGLQTTLMPLRAVADGISPATVGYMMSAYYLGYIAGCVFVPRVVQQTGHIRTFATFAAFASAIAIGQALYVDAILWAVLRGLAGFCFAGLAMVAESWLNEMVSDSNRGRLGSVYRVIDLAALTGGQALIIVAPITGFELFAIVAIAITLALVPLTLAATHAPSPIPGARLPLISLIRASPVGVFGVLAVGLANGAFWSLGPIYASNVGRGEGFVAAFMGLAIIGGALSAYPIGRFSDRVDRRKVIAAMHFITTAFGIVLMLIGGMAGIALLPLVGLYGAAMLPLYSLCAAHTNDRLAAGQFVYASRGLLLMFATGAALGTTGAAELMEAFGAPALFGYTAAIFGCMGLFTLYRILRHEPPPTAESVGFAAVSGTSPSAFTAEPQAAAATEGAVEVEVVEDGTDDDTPQEQR